MVYPSRNMQNLSWACFIAPWLYSLYSLFMKFSYYAHCLRFYFNSYRFVKPSLLMF